jgi:hypothetical protein
VFGAEVASVLTVGFTLGLVVDRRREAGLDFGLGLEVRRVMGGTDQIVCSHQQLPTYCIDKFLLLATDSSLKPARPAGAAPPPLRMRSEATSGSS